MVFDNLELTIDSLRNRAVVPLTKAVEWLISKFNEISDWVRDHEELITGIFVALTPVIAAAATAAIAFAAALVIANIAAIAMYAAIAAVIGLVALLYEDFMIWKEGGKSAIGELLGPFAELKKQIQPVVDLLERMTALYERIQKGGGLIRMGVDWTAEKVGAGANFANRAIDSVKAGRGLLGAANTSPFASQTSQAILARGGAGGKTINNNIGPVNVNTQATDAEGTGKAVQQHVAKQFRFAADNSDDGVDR